MSIKKNASIFTASALALAVSGAAQAYTIEAGDTTANIYGYAKLDLIYDVDDKLGNAINRNAIRLDGEPGSDGHTDLHAFQSRLGFTTATPAGGSEIKTMIEGDFYGSGGGEFRLRHAYGEWNGLLAGQTWTNFGGFLGMNPTIDFNGQPGQANVARQAQLRYTVEGFSVALEDPENLGGSVDSAASKSRLPDLTLRFQGGAGDFSYAASGVLRYLEFDDVVASQKDSTTGWGLALEASAKVTPDVTLRGSIVHGDGIGAYQYLAPVGTPAYVDGSGNLETIKGTGGTAGVSVAAGPGNVSLGYGISTVDLDDAVADGAMAATANEKFEGVFLNYIWSPIRNVTYGVEAGYHSRKQVDGDKGDAVRVQGMVQYNF
ncbi:DcaP family trimeric outer membrane transporter [Halomonas sp. Y3]|uniref:DcaP family trimeric outer membrane transporter n=1 Tax=Halomonas sp. Y3 TaxID=2956797 RepID=UPI0020A076FF|nr:DcaP family trimeric outer membrane transporter [Halomonas sp. Y3]